MFELNLEPWELLPPDHEKWLSLIKAGSYPLMRSEGPEPGKMVRLYPGEYFSGNGVHYHGNLRLGSDDLLVFFNGGGVSYNEYTAARPNNLFTGHLKEAYYFNDTEWMGDYSLHNSLCAKREDNPFSTWSLIHLLYGNGDFHCGDGDFPYTALDGSKRILKHHGYRNAMAVIEQAKMYLPSPKRLVIAGVSAGGFGTALLSDSVIALFPECEDITVCVDSSLLFANWGKIAREVWHTPAHIQKNLISDNLTLDCLTALYEKYGTRVKILFASSVRDALLVEAQNGLEGKKLTFDKSSGKRYQEKLKEMCANLQKRIPHVGLYIFEAPMDQPGFDEAELTKHCLLDNGLFYTHTQDDVTPAQWLLSAVDSNVKKIGMNCFLKTLS